MDVLYCCVSRIANLAYHMLESQKMMIRVKLIASYRDRLPAGVKNGTVELDVPEGITVREVISRFDIPLDDTSVIVLNGLTVDLDTPLQAGDMVTAFSAIAGG